MSDKKAITLGEAMENNWERRTQTKAKHTPGPWKADIYGAHPEDAIGGQIDGPNGEHIADLPNHGPDSGITPRQFEANARLIAAAPALLSALEEIVSLTERDNFTTAGGPAKLRRTVRDLAQAAIERSKP